MQDGIAKAKLAGVSMFMPFVACRMAEVLLERGQLGEADTVLSAERDRMATTREVAYEGELLRLQARVRLHAGDDGAARELLGRALDVARSQGALSLELRAALDYAEALSSAAEAEDATAQLSATLDRWPEGDVSRDVLAARASLRRLTERVDENP
jgi:ATP/maltotriose-dependent transcriptional regulator MalT